MGKRTYCVYVWCRNCGNSRTVNIPTGTPIASHPCPSCGCKELRR